jgi:hypothetical protein
MHARANTRAMNSRSLLIAAACWSCQPSAGPAPTASAPPATATAASSTPSSAPAASASNPSPAPGIVGFDKDKIDAAPPGFAFGRTGGGAEGRWVVHADPTAPSPPNVLAQLDADSTDVRFPVAVLSEPRLRDVRVRVRCKLVSGKVDQACGLVARYGDANNYYVTRANALENNVRVYFVKDGKRKELASWSGAVKAGAWHDYAFEVRGDRLQVQWAGQQVLDHRDGTFTEAGLVGVWTKADSVSYFDDLSVEAFE